MHNEYLKILNNSYSVGHATFDIHHLMAHGLYSKHCKWALEREIYLKTINTWRPVKQFNKIKMPSLNDGKIREKLILHSVLCRDDQSQAINRHKDNFELKQPLICIMQQKKGEMSAYAARQLYKHDIVGIWIAAPTSINQSLEQNAKCMKHKRWLLPYVKGKNAMDRLCFGSALTRDCQHSSRHNCEIDSTDGSYLIRATTDIRKDTELNIKFKKSQNKIFLYDPSNVDANDEDDVDDVDNNDDKNEQNDNMNYEETKTDDSSNKKSHNTKNDDDNSNKRKHEQNKCNENKKNKNNKLSTTNDNVDSKNKNALIDLSIDNEDSSKNDNNNDDDNESIEHVGDETTCTGSQSLDKLFNEPKGKQMFHILLHNTTIV